MENIIYAKRMCLEKKIKEKTDTIMIVKNFSLFENLNLDLTLNFFLQGNEVVLSLG